ncbi:hypothetical protein EW146_g2394 [Bondarzewia mesenterica]|uniref:RNA-dependent RNA polymerase n=1 Tax=Bondarzewia mesenterica TaxID=1095465 RepID=A0A4V3XFS2_9AGAM|nr:hypothetical protein EW146_g2394 [Bondarzewia mesenterica]
MADDPYGFRAMIRKYGKDLAKRIRKSTPGSIMKVGVNVEQILTDSEMSATSTRPSSMYSAFSRTASHSSGFNSGSGSTSSAARRSSFDKSASKGPIPMNISPMPMSHRSVKFSAACARSQATASRLPKPLDIPNPFRPEGDSASRPTAFQPSSPPNTTPHSYVRTPPSPRSPSPKRQKSSMIERDTLPIGPTLASPLRIREPNPSTTTLDDILGTGPLQLDVRLIAHSDAVQREMDARKIAWGVQFEIARGVSCGDWKWEQVTTTKLDHLKGCNADAAPLVRRLLLDQPTSGNSGSMTASGDLALWQEYDREQEALYEGLGRGLGLMGAWKGVVDWFGGKIHQTVRITPTSSTTYSLRLEKPKISKSHRVARYLGSRHILEIKLPEMGKFDPNSQSRKMLLDKFVLCGRVYVPFDAKDGKVYAVETTENYGRRSDNSQGDDHRLSFQQFIQWYNSLSLNNKQPISKWAARFDLGLSTSTPVLQFSPENIIFIPDIYAPHDHTQEKVPAEKVMTDGCGWMNRAALILIAQRLCLSSRPSAVQGRVAGSKGMWTLHPTDHGSTAPPRIWIRDSQRKIELPTLSERAYVIFDLLAVARLTSPGHLSSQLILNMWHNGVPDEVFQRLLEKGLEEEVSPLMQWACPEAMPLLWSAVNKAGSVSGARMQRLAGASSRALGLGPRFEREADADDEPEGVDAESAFDYAANTLCRDGGSPPSLHETVLNLLQSGFRPQNCVYLRDELKLVITRAIESYIRKYRISVPQSAEAFIIPDPLGVLDEHQIHFKASREINDPITDVNVCTVTGPCIVSRNPSRIASDLQKVEAIIHPLLSEYVDVIVFSIKGERSLASYLGGGDYDGDTAMVTWDPSIVEPFRNSSFIPAPVDFINTNFDRQIETVEAFARRISNVSPDIAHREMIKVLLGGLTNSEIGRYSTFHDNAVYACGYTHPKAVRLAYMFTTCLDSGKSGLRLKEGVFKADSKAYGYPKARCMQSEEGEESSRMQDHNTPPLPRDSSLPKFILESLLDTGSDLKKRYLIKYEALDVQPTRQDKDLLQPWKDVQEAAATPFPDDAFNFVSQDLRQKIQDELHRVRKAEISRVENYILSIKAEWMTAVHPPSPSKTAPSPRKKKIRSQSVALVQDVVKKFADGLADVSWASEDVRASCAYTIASRLGDGKFPFSVAFRGLCHIKAQVAGITPITQQFTDAMTMQSSALRMLSKVRSGLED